MADCLVDFVAAVLFVLLLLRGCRSLVVRCLFPKCIQLNTLTLVYHHNYFLLVSFCNTPPSERQHYRLYAIHRIPSLKTLDFTKVTKSERDKAERLANSAAGAALESDVQQEAKSTTTKTFVPGEGESAEESFVTNFTPEQKETIRQMVANAKSPAEIDEIERSVRRGIFPAHLAPPDDRKRAAEEPAVNGTDAKRSRI